jgi:hypothetical protein
MKTFSLLAVGGLFVYTLILKGLISVVIMSLFALLILKAFK